MVRATTSDKMATMPSSRCEPRRVRPEKTAILLTLSSKAQIHVLPTGHGLRVPLLMKTLDAPVSPIRHRFHVDCRWLSPLWAGASRISEVACQSQTMLRLEKKRRRFVVFRRPSAGLAYHHSGEGLLIGDKLLAVGMSRSLNGLSLRGDLQDI
jgi:hypothetical protein